MMSDWPRAAWDGVLAAGDRLYAWVIRQRYENWEASVERDADGVRTGCREYTVGDGPAALLMVHGFGDSPAIFRLVADELADRGFTCRAMRLPGFAEPMERYARTTRPRWSAAVRDELAALRADHDPVWLVGHSTGAALMVREQLEGAGADGLILLAPLIAVSDRRSPLVPARTWFRWLKPYVRETTMVENVFAPDSRDPEVRRYNQRDSFVPLNLYHELFDLVDEIDGRAGEITAPTLLVVSPRDRVIDADRALAYFDALGSLRKRTLIAENSGHMVTLDPDWPAVVDAIEAFVEGEGDGRERNDATERNDGREREDGQERNDGGERKQGRGAGADR